MRRPWLQGMEERRKWIHQQNWIEEDQTETNKGKLGYNDYGCTTVPPKLHLYRSATHLLLTTEDPSGPVLLVFLPA